MVEDRIRNPDLCCGIQLVYNHQVVVKSEPGREDVIDLIKWLPNGPSSEHLPATSNPTNSVVPCVFVNQQVIFSFLLEISVILEFILVTFGFPLRPDEAEM